MHLCFLSRTLPRPTESSRAVCLLPCDLEVPLWPHGEGDCKKAKFIPSLMQQAHQRSQGARSLGREVHIQNTCYCHYSSCLRNLLSVVTVAPAQHELSFAGSCSPAGWPCGISLGFSVLFSLFVCLHSSCLLVSVLLVFVTVSLCPHPVSGLSILF